MTADFVGVPMGIAIGLLKEAGLHICVWDPGANEDPCHEAIAPHYRPIKTEDAMDLLCGVKRLDKWGRVN